MNYHVVEVRYVSGHVLWLRFRDGTIGEIDLRTALEGPAFEALRDAGDRIRELEPPASALSARLSAQTETKLP